MTNAMFGSLGHKAGFKSYKYGHLLPVLTAEQLLGSRQHNALLEHIENLVQFEDFDFLYGRLIRRFAEWVQLLPDTHGDYLGSLLNISLMRAFLALKEYKQRYLGKMKHQVDQAKAPLLYFCVFSAALLQDVAKVVSQQRVILCDESGEFEANWLPFAGPMQGSHYRLYEIAGVFDTVENDLVVMLARQLMPVEGFHWIAAHSDVLIEWLHALKKNYTFVGRITDVLNIMDKLIAENMAEFNQLPFIDVEMLECPDLALGEAFLQWIKNGLADGSLNYNAANAGIHRVAEGVFLEYPSLAKAFAKAYGKEAPMARVFAQFGNLLGVTKKGGQDFAFDQFFSGYPEMQTSKSFSGIMSSKTSSTRQGLVVSEPGLLFKGELPPVTEKLKAVKVDAQRMSYIFQQATAKGKRQRAVLTDRFKG